jgi:hypothetical protein
MSSSGRTPFSAAQPFRDYIDLVAIVTGNTESAPAIESLASVMTWEFPTDDSVNHFSNLMHLVGEANDEELLFQTLEREDAARAESIVAHIAWVHMTEGDWEPDIAQIQGIIKAVVMMFGSRYWAPLPEEFPVASTVTDEGSDDFPIWLEYDDDGQQTYRYDEEQGDQT